MSQPWTVSAATPELDAARRAALADDMAEWLAAGGNGVALVTCHRAELYGFGPTPQLATACIYSGEPAICHLLRVACGLESVIVGEDEVLHQVRKALDEARRRTKLDRRLHRLFETAIATGRRARSRRTESNGNLAQSAIAWLQERADVSGRMVVVAGAGRMGAALAHSIRQAGAQIVVASRDADKAARLARVYAGRGVDLRTGAEMTGQAAAVAVALGGPWNELEIVTVPNFPPTADISAPQAIPDAVRRRMNGNFLGIDDLDRRGGCLPGPYVEDAERLVAVKTAEYQAWLARTS